MRLLCLALLSLFVVTLSCVSAFCEDSSGITTPLPLTGMPGYGISLDSHPSFDSSGNYRLYVVRLHTPDAEQYDVLDTILTSTVPTVCSTSSIAFIQRSENELRILTINVDDPEKTDTVLTLVRQLGGGDVQWFAFRQQDSLIALSELLLPSPNCRTLIAHLAGPISLDTVVCLKGCCNPRFSGDGSEIFLDTWDRNEGSMWVPGVGVYDITTSTMTRPVESKNGLTLARRVAKGQPIYYVRYGPSGLGNVWCYDSLGGEQQVTFVFPPEYVSDYEVTMDTIWYRVMEHDESFTDLFKRIESIPLREAGLK